MTLRTLTCGPLQKLPSHLDRQAECPWIAIVGGYGYHEWNWRFTPPFPTFTHGVLPVTTATTTQTNLGTGEVVDVPSVFATAADDLLVEGAVELQTDRVNVHVAPRLFFFSSHLFLGLLGSCRPGQLGPRL